VSRVLLTGAAGFIGHHLLTRLVERGHAVSAVTTRPVGSGPRPVGSGPRPVGSGPPGVRWITADLLEPDVPAALVDEEDVTHLVHLAWHTRPSVYTSPENVRWVEASLRLLRALGARGGARAVLVGTCAEYDWSYGLCSEWRTPTEGASLYGASKDALRRIAQAAGDELGVSVAWARPFFLYGPREHESRLVPAVIRPLLRGEPAPCSEGWQLRDYLHVGDAADALAHLLDSALEGPVNVGSGVPVRVRDVAATIGELLGRPELVAYGALGDGRGEAPLVLADTTRLRTELGWTPRVSLRAGLDDAIEFWRSCEGQAS
jgi:nucleoside-diphosphate-sugar epimerase